MEDDNKKNEDHRRTEDSAQFETDNVDNEVREEEEDNAAAAQSENINQTNADDIPEVVTDENADQAESDNTNRINILDKFTLLVRNYIESQANNSTNLNQMNSEDIPSIVRNYCANQSESNNLEEINMDDIPLIVRNYYADQSVRNNLKEMNSDDIPVLVRDYNADQSASSSGNQMNTDNIPLLVRDYNADQSESNNENQMNSDNIPLVVMDYNAEQSESDNVNQINPDDNAEQVRDINADQSESDNVNQINPDDNAEQVRDINADQEESDIVRHINPDDNAERVRDDNPDQAVSNNENPIVVVINAVRVELPQYFENQDCIFLILNLLNLQDQINLMRATPVLRQIVINYWLRTPRFSFIPALNTHVNLNDLHEYLPIVRERIEHLHLPTDNEAFITELSRYVFPNVRTLRCARGHPVNNSVLLEMFPNMTIFELENVTEAIDMIIFRNLTELTLHRVNRYPWKADCVAQFLKELPNLRRVSVNLDGAMSLQNVNVTPQLREFRLKAINMAHVESLVDLPRLRVLNLQLRGASRIGTFVTILNRRYRDIVILELRDTDNLPFHMLRRLTSLRRLLIQGYGAWDNPLNHFEKLTNLEALQYVNSRHIGMRDLLGFIRFCCNLNSLDLTGTQLIVHPNMNYSRDVMLALDNRQRVVKMKLYVASDGSQALILHWLTHPILLIEWEIAGAPSGFNNYYEFLPLNNDDDEEQEN